MTRFFHAIGWPFSLVAVALLAAPWALAQEAPESQPAGEDAATEVPRLEFSSETVELSGNAGGSVDASTMGEGCVGMVGESPSLVLVVSGQMPDLSVDGGEHDLTLVVVSQDGSVYCVDDVFGTNPFVNLWDRFDPVVGEYNLFIGTKDGASHPFTVQVADGAG